MCKRLWILICNNLEKRSHPLVALYHNSRLGVIATQREVAHSNASWTNCAARSAQHLCLMLKCTNNIFFSCHVTTAVLHCICWMLIKHINWFGSLFDCFHLDVFHLKPQICSDLQPNNTVYNQFTARKFIEPSAWNATSWKRTRWLDTTCSHKTFRQWNDNQLKCWNLSPNSIVTLKCTHWIYIAAWRQARPYALCHSG